MSQFNFGNLGSPLSGTAFIDDNLEPWRNALHSNHKGATRPTYVVAGMRWIDDADSNMWILKLFTGSEDIIEAYADTVNNVIVPADEVDADQVAYDNTVSGLTAVNAQEALDELAAFKNRSEGFAGENDGVAIGAVEKGYWVTPPPGRLELDGTAGLLRADYQDLYDHLNSIGLIVTEGTKAFNQFGNGNGTTTFSLADARDMFFRSKSGARALGSYQTDDIKTHPHPVRIQNLNVAAGSSGIYGLVSGASNSSAIITEGPGGTETRPKNISLMVCIKY